jgi:hypothetical protein
MKRFYVVVIAAVAFAGAASVAAAQTSSSVLNKLEVQKLVAAGLPVADLRLAAHFNAVAARYDEEAARYRAAAAVFTANANRSAATNAASSCERWSANAAEWAAAARELAKYHVRLASGRTAIVPRGAAELHAGRGAPEPTAEQLHKLALTARTRTDHLELEEYYAIVATKKAAEADRHLRMATGYVAGVRNGTYDPAVTRDRLARLARKAAKTATEAANRHRILATVA